ncbi:lytic transglycosylase domain-containing protein [Caldisalinibacter kiritimatiensis]|uniref:Soluble lytic murein transglycosylase n=1 Tax=Caldisalinibacter kiritimatiensis TaxID=1304284 RepID=R1CF67_9FIRM|nr:transglycosylase SLT domain-containing protein [Caldisalinibacter kiritimatiensis]EOD00935.1 Soluble lytic murein transglycosylase precursor [Caldisalinibacter kiritimatiensis]
MKKKVLLSVAIFTIILTSTVYGIMLAQNGSKAIKIEVINNKRVAMPLDTEYLFEQAEKSKKLQFVTDMTGLSTEVSEYLIKQCELRELDIFLVLGLMKLESNFNTKAVGSKGERGLGQLMENTAKPLAKNLGLEYNPDYLFDPKYNIRLFTTQLWYLNKVLDKDIHKVLTAYNRGEYGLKKYMASRAGKRNPAVSDYSLKVLEYASKFKKQYDNN